LIRQGFLGLCLKHEWLEPIPDYSLVEEVGDAYSCDAHIALGAIFQRVQFTLVEKTYGLLAELGCLSGVAFSLIQ